MQNTPPIMRGHESNVIQGEESSIKIGGQKILTLSWVIAQVQWE